MMLIPKTDKWVLVRWHGGVRSVVKAKYLLKHLAPGEDLKISAVVKVASSQAGKPDTVTVLTSGNERRQLELLSEPGERPPSSDEERPEPEPEPEPPEQPDINDENEDPEEDFEDSSSDWTPDGPSTEESDISESEKDTSKRGKSSSKPSPKKRQSTKESSEESTDDEATKQKRMVILAKTLEKLSNIYSGADRMISRINKKRRREQDVEEGNNEKKEDTPKKIKQKSKCKDYNKSMPEVITYMHSMFAGLYQVIVSGDPDAKCPTKCKKVKVGVDETGDVMIVNNKFYKRNNRNSEYFDRTLTPDEADVASASEFEKIKNKSEVFDKTLTPHESDDEPLATLGKNNTTAPVKNKKTSKTGKDKKTPKLRENFRTSTPVQNKKLLEASTEDDSSDCDYSSDRSDDPVLISNKYETIQTSHNEPEAEWIPIGTGTTLIHKDKFAQVNWKSYTKATRTLLTAAFSRRTLATHSLTGKKSPAFVNKPAKMCLDPKIVSDIVIEVGDKFKIRDNLVRNIITTKCADECKMRKLKKEKKKALKAKSAQASNEPKDSENNNQENVPKPKRTPKSSKKKYRKSTSPKIRNISKIYKKYNRKSPKKVAKKIKENIMLPEDDINKSHPDKEENMSLRENNTISIKKKETDILSSDDDNMVIDEDYTPPSDNIPLKSIENKNQINILPPENSPMRMRKKVEYTPPVHMNMRSKNQENIPPPEKNTSKSIKNKDQEYIPAPVKKNMKGFKTYKNKSKTK